MEIAPEGGITSPEGFLAGATYCGLKQARVPDLVLIYSTAPCAVGATFTTNQLKSNSLRLAQAHVRDGRAQAIIANSGNANACTGNEGHAVALEMASLAAEKLRVRTEDVIVASTGIIGVALPIEKVRQGLKGIQVTRDGGHDAARGIMTTDRVPKESAVRLAVGGRTVTIGGIAKGAGMIHPNMATMFAFLATDAAIEAAHLQEITGRAVANSFNMIDIDGDTSPSDTVAVLANGLAGNTPLRRDTADAAAFAQAVEYVCQSLAKAMVRDGEGAEKLIEVRVIGAASAEDARLAARGVASSSLVKSAVHGGDPNWGRVLTAVGYSGSRLDQDIADIAVGEVPLMESGQIAPFDPKAASEAFRGDEVVFTIDLHLGPGSATAWGCDLSEEYVRFNSKYTT